MEGGDVQREVGSDGAYHCPEPLSESLFMIYSREDSYLYLDAFFCSMCTLCIFIFIQLFAFILCKQFPGGFRYELVGKFPVYLWLDG
jgi:hypothetical protein